MNKAEEAKWKKIKIMSPPMNFLFNEPGGKRGIKKIEDRRLQIET